MLVIGDVAHPGEGAETQPVRADGYIVQPLDAADIDQMRRPAHIVLEELQHVGAAGEEFGPRLLRGQGKRVLGAPCAAIDKGMHGHTLRPDATVLIAATMLG